MSEIYIGLMSGTSLDGADGVLVDFAHTRPRVLASASVPFPAPFKSELLALNSPGNNELHRAALAANQLVSLYSAVVHRLLASASGISGQQVKAIAAHGQTVRHRPQEFGDAHTPGTGYTLQINNPALLAELTGMDVIADFRTADLAAGGQGAPLVPAFHQAMFGHPTQSRAVLNIGGISNITLLPASAGVQGFDCGPGNALMDFWCQRHTGQAFDNDGAWAAGGQLIPDLLQQFLADPYFSRSPPKSTGRDLFNPAWLERQLKAFGPCEARDVQSTLTALTAHACAQDLRQCLPEASELLVCGGGALNTELMRQLADRLPEVMVQSTQAQGMPPLEVEAAAFAWLARAWHQRLPGNLTAVTGARGPRVLGALYPASAY